MKKLPTWLLITACILAPILSGLSVYQAVTPFLPLPAAFILYGIAFVCLVVFCIRTPKGILDGWRRLATYLRERFHAVEVFFTNNLIRSIVLAIPGVAMGLFYTALNAFLGIWYDSAWNGTLAGYFLILTGMRVLVVQSYRRKKKGISDRQELRTYSICGVLLSILSITLAGAVTLLIHGIPGKTYPGFLVYAMAAYTFYKIYASIRGMVTARQQESLLMIALRNIGHADALMSLLCLQTGLLNAFDGGDAAFAMRMNGITGGAVALAALVMGLSMIVGAVKRRKQHGTNPDCR